VQVKGSIEGETMKQLENRRSVFTRPMVRNPKEFRKFFYGATALLMLGVGSFALGTGTFVKGKAAVSVSKSAVVAQ
jgi:hypothetical protein